MARRARRAAAQETLALPETDGRRSRIPGAAVDPVRRVLAGLRIVREQRHEVVEVVLPRREAQVDEGSSGSSAWSGRRLRVVALHVVVRVVVARSRAIGCRLPWPPSVYYTGFP
jgi:hypothetical protein